MYACIYCKEPIKNFLESNVTTSVKFKNFYLDMYILFERVFCYLSFQIINVIISRNLLHNVTPNVWIYISLFRVKKKYANNAADLITLVNVFTILRCRCVYMYMVSICLYINTLIHLYYNDCNYYCHYCFFSLLSIIEIIHLILFILLIRYFLFFFF